MSRAQPIQSGELNQKLVVRNEERTTLPGGSSTTEYLPRDPSHPSYDEAAWRAAMIPARVRSLRGREGMLARQVIGSTGHEVAIRLKLPSGVTLTSKSRLEWVSHPLGTRTLELTEPPRTDSTNRFLLFLCTEREAA